MENHAESSIIFVKNLILDPKRANLYQKSEIGHVRTCQDLFYEVNLSSFIRSSALPSEFIIFFINSSVLPNKFIIFYKIIGFTKQIYTFTSPYRQTTFLLLKFQGLRFLYFY